MILLLYCSLYHWLSSLMSMSNPSTNYVNNILGFPTIVLVGRRMTLKQGRSHLVLRGFIRIPLAKNYICIVEILFYAYLIDVESPSTISCVYFYGFWTSHWKSWLRHWKRIPNEVEADGIDTSFIVVSLTLFFCMQGWCSLQRAYSLN